MQRDAFAQSESYDVDEFNGDIHHEHYDYWIQSFFEYKTRGVIKYTDNLFFFILSQ